ncbi:MAG TPA: hypothetical protein DCR55_00270 [Lentisphaeria bacterium]|nr:hypothetical protein [Lentisphaeria bacterium]
MDVSYEAAPVSTMSVRLLPFLVISVLLFGCRHVEPRSPGDLLHHVVLCWLHDSGNSAQQAAIIETSRTFSQIPGVVSVTAGEMVPSSRALVDSSFDVGICLTFRNQADLDTCLTHPLHLAAVKTVLRPIVSKRV